MEKRLYKGKNPQLFWVSLSLWDFCSKSCGTFCRHWHLHKKNKTGNDISTIQKLQCLILKTVKDCSFSIKHSPSFFLCGQDVQTLSVVIKRKVEWPLLEVSWHYNSRSNQNYTSKPTTDVILWEQKTIYMAERNMLLHIADVQDCFSRKGRKIFRFFSY